MRRTFTRGATAVAFACATAGLLAGPAAAQTTSTASTTNQSARHAVTYSGCLRSGADVIGSGSTLTPGSSAGVPLSGYVLTGVRTDPNMPPSTETAPPGQSAATTTPPATP